MISHKELLECLHYDPETGVFTRAKRTSQNMRIGDIAGTKTARGYWNIGLLGKYYRAHRLAYFYMTGQWPADDIDHINGNRSDNRWANLRAVTKQENRKNARKYKSNTSGYTGIHYYRAYDKWSAHITSKNKTKCLGYFASKTEAIRERALAELHFGFHPNHGRAT